MEGNGGATGTQGGTEATSISATPPDDVDMHEGQDQETVVGVGIHLDGVVAHWVGGNNTVTSTFFRHSPDSCVVS